MPIYIAPSFVKLVVLRYSGLGEVEGRERNRKGNSTRTRPPAFCSCAAGIRKDQFLNLVIWNVKRSFTLHLLHKEQHASCQGRRGNVRRGVAGSGQESASINPEQLMLWQLP